MVQMEGFNFDRWRLDFGTETVSILACDSKRMKYICVSISYSLNSCKHMSYKTFEHAYLLTAEKPFHLEVPPFR
jgi:hypothetical protein